MKAVLFLLFCATVAFGINSPLLPCGTDPSGNGLCLSLSLQRYDALQQMAVGDQVTITGFRLEKGGRPGILSLKRFSAAEDQSDLKYVVLLRGSFRFGDVIAFEDDERFELRKGSTAFLALSPHGSNGFIEVSANSTYFLSTPWKSFEGKWPGVDRYVDQLTTAAQAHLGKAAAEHVSVLFEQSHMDPNGQQVSTDYILPPEELVSIDGAQADPSDNKPFERRTFRVASDVDYQMYQIKGYNYDATSSYYYTLIGSTSSIYARDFGHDLTSSYLRIYQSQDPYPYSASAALEYMQRTWSTSTPSRSFASLVSAKSLGGGIAYYRTLCYLVYAYAVNGNMVGYFPTPLRDYDVNNWDIYVYAHEGGHVWGGQHTHELSPPADNCGNSGSCGATQGTILSYCHICTGGLRNIALQFHTRNEDQIRAFVNPLVC